LGVYAYCVLPATRPPADSLTGVQDRPVAALQIDDLLIWVSHGPRPEPSLEAVQAHNRVVETAVTNTVTPVPLRFGQWLENEAALRSALAERVPGYRRQLAEFAGCLEFGLRLLDPAATPKARDVQASTGTSGFEYMQALRESSRLAEQQREHAETVRARVHETLQDVVRAERVAEERTPHGVLTVAHLVARPRFDEYRERARQLRTMFPAMRLMVSGPWPPYSFAA
jgi:hypothetical protein